MRALARTAALILLVLASLPLAPCSAEQAVVGNDELYKMIGGKAHEGMAKQLDRLQKVLEAFLSGDMQKVQSSLILMEHDLDVIAQKYNMSGNDAVPELKALNEMKSNVSQFERSAAEKNFEDSFRHFTAITHQCIECHQVRRTWGKLEDVRFGGGASAPAQPQQGSASKGNNSDSQEASASDDAKVKVTME